MVMMVMMVMMVLGRGRRFKRRDGRVARQTRRPKCPVAGPLGDAEDGPGRCDAAIVIDAGPRKMGVCKSVRRVGPGVLACVGHDDLLLP